MPPPPPDNATIAAGAIRRRHAAREPSPPIAPSDGELLGVFTRDARANEAAFAQLVERHGPMVWRVCRQVLAHRQDAEDAFQATFLILARRASAIRSSESAAGWLYRVAHRTAIAARRKARRRKESRMSAEPLAPETAFPNLAGRETARVMMEELAAMPAKYRTPLVLRYLEGRSRREIAEQTDATIATVQGQLARGKAMLRGRLLRRGVSLSAAMMVVAGGQAAHASAQMTDGAPAQLIAQTTSNATAIATGGSLAASTAVVLLYREGVRAMFFAEVMKPVAVVAVALLLLGGAAIGAGETTDTQHVGKPAGLVLDATPPQDEEVADSAVTFLTNLEEATDAEEAEPANDQARQFTDAFTFKNWGFDANGIARDLSSNNPLTDEELERRIRKFYAASPPDTLRPRSPLFETEARYSYWAYRAQELRRETALLRKEVEANNKASDDDIRRLSSLTFDAGLAQANAIAARRELDKLLAAQPKSRETSTPAEAAAATRPTPLNGETIEYWPGGKKRKLVREYREGRVVEMIEYAEDGKQILYSMEDNSNRSALRAVNDNTAQQPPNGFRLASTDKLNVAMWDREGQNVLSGDYHVTKDGRLKLLSYGDVRAAGRTLAELQRDLLNDARRRLNKPALQIRLIHKRFGAVGGNDEPGVVDNEPVQAEAATLTEKRQLLELLQKLRTKRNEIGATIGIGGPVVAEALKLIDREMEDVREQIAIIVLKETEALLGTFILSEEGNTQQSREDK